MSMIAPVIAAARQVSPTIEKRLAVTTIRFLSCWRNWIRWWTVGAIRKTLAAVASSSVTK